MFNTADFSASKPKPQSEFRPNLFDVRFTKLPNSTEELRDKLRFLICNTCLPPIGLKNSWGKDWAIDVITDMDVYDYFCDWVNNNFESKGEAVITLYKPDGDTLREYTIKNLQIMSVDAIDLNWSYKDLDADPFHVEFRIADSEPDQLESDFRNVVHEIAEQA